MWDPDSTAKDVGDSIADTIVTAYGQLSDMETILTTMRYDKMQECLRDPQKMKIVLEQNGKDPSLADNPEYMRKLRQKIHDERKDFEREQFDQKQFEMEEFEVEESESEY